ncbi:MAG: DNA-directed RNA polymerase subunit delta [Bacilli bacterium]|nr:DNA-directed RNA polymerase subunit delta [Bacilli bacterium]
MKTTKSMRDCAYDEITTACSALTFADLYARVAAALEMTEEEKKAHIGAFYTDLTLDGRFVALTDNNWDLRERHTYEKVHISISEVYSAIEEANAEYQAAAREDGEEEEDELEESMDKKLDEEGENGSFQDEEEEKSTGESLESLGINN